jgi:hypothetical protein
MTAKEIAIESNGIEVSCTNHPPHLRNDHILIKLRYDVTNIITYNLNCYKEV